MQSAEPQSDFETMNQEELTGFISAVNDVTEQLPEEHEQWLDTLPVDALRSYRKGLVQGGKTAQRLEDSDEINQLNTELRTDIKTGISNERGWRENLKYRIEDLKPGDKLIAYVIDIDGFKTEVNDKFGHPIGDEFLVLVAQSLAVTYRRNSDDLARGSRENKIPESIARLGGDEYGASTIIRAEENKRRQLTPEQQAEMQIERANSILQEQLQGTKFEGANVSLSIGWSEYEEGDTVDSLVARADLDMYRVKYEGKTAQITEEDRDELRRIIPYLEKLGSRVEGWLKKVIEEAA